MSTAALQPWQYPAADAACRVADETTAFGYAIDALQYDLDQWRHDPGNTAVRARAEDNYGLVCRTADRYRARLDEWKRVADGVSAIRADTALRRRLIEDAHRVAGRGPDGVRPCTCRQPWPCPVRESSLAHVVQVERLLEVVDGLRATEVELQVLRRRCRVADGGGSNV